MSGNGRPSMEELAKTAVLELSIRYAPALGQLMFSFPQCDDIIRMGMLEAAKSALIEARIANAGNKIIQPSASLPSGVKM